MNISMHDSKGVKQYLLIFNRLKPIYFSFQQAPIASTQLADMKADGAVRTQDL